MTFLLHVHYPSGGKSTLTFPTRIARALFMITIGPLPVALREEDR